MPLKVADVVTRVRQLLQDDGTRYPDDQLLNAVNDAVLQVRSIRPDLFVRAYTEPLAQAASLQSVFPLPAQFFLPVVMFSAGMMELRDDEFAVDGRAATLIAALNSKLTKGL